MVVQQIVRFDTMHSSSRNAFPNITKYFCCTTIIPLLSAHTVLKIQLKKKWCQKEEEKSFDWIFRSTPSFPRLQSGFLDAHINNTGLIVLFSPLRFICSLHCMPNRVTVQWSIVSCIVGCFFFKPLEVSRAHISTLTVCDYLSFTVSMNDSATDSFGLNGQAWTCSEREQEKSFS